MTYPDKWIDRWLEMGIGELHESRIPQYESDIISMPYEREIRNVLYFCYRGGDRLLYPKEQALPMIELMQVGI